MGRQTAVIGVLAVAGAIGLAAAQAPKQETPQQFVTIEQVDGVSNFAHVETTVACGGVTSPSAVPAIKKMGFVSIINLREASEPGANIEAEEAAAKAVGMKFFHIPFNGQTPDASVVDRFLDVVTSPGAQPAYIHCQGGNRAATMWFAKRLVVDHWDEERAYMEAGPLGLTSPRLKEFIVEYARTHKR
jgi:uncharacterized protein (TIGR01244 family)